MKKLLLPLLLTGLLGACQHPTHEANTPEIGKQLSQADSQLQQLIADAWQQRLAESHRWPSSLAMTRPRVS